MTYIFLLAAVECLLDEVRLIELSPSLLHVPLQHLHILLVAQLQALLSNYVPKEVAFVYGLEPDAEDALDEERLSDGKQRHVIYHLDQELTQTVFQGVLECLPELLYESQLEVVVLAFLVVGHEEGDDETHPAFVDSE